MSNKRLWIPGAIALAVLVLVPLSSVKAEAYIQWELDNHWFVVTANVAARAVATATGNVSAFATQFKFYIYFEDEGRSDGVGHTYDYYIYSQMEPGVWKRTYWAYEDSEGFYEETSPYNAQFLPDMKLHIHKQDGTCVYAHISPHVSSVMNLFNGGGQVYNGTNPDETRALYGTITVTGKVATSLPFTPGSTD